MNKKILVAIHPGYIDSPAIERAVTFASATDVDIMLYSAVYDDSVPSLYIKADDLDKMRELILDSETVRLKQIKSRLLKVAKSVEVQTQWINSAADGITNAAKQFNADLLIVSSTRHSTMTRLFLSNTDLEILRHASTPVLFAHNHPEKAYKKVMVAVDPTHEHDEPAELEHRMISIGKWITDIFDGELYLAHAYPSIRPELTIDNIVPVEVPKKMREEHEKALKQLAATHNIEKDKTHFLDGYPRVALPDMAREIKSDLVIMGVISRSVIDRLMIGSTAEYLLDHIECDILTVNRS